MSASGSAGSHPAAPASVAIRARGLQKRFGEITAVHSVSLDIARGELFGVLGPNGSGKTTLLRMLCGLLEPTAGEAVVLGEDVRLRPDAVKARVGYMSQRFGLYDDLTVAENLRFYAEIYGVPRALRAERMAAMLRLAGLESRARQFAGTLSGGWKQRLALACATVHAPQLILLDEPTAGVDPASRRRFWSIIDDLARGGTTILVTTHYMDEAERFARVAFISFGHLIAVGRPEEVVAQHAGARNLEDVFVSLQAEEER